MILIDIPALAEAARALVKYIDYLNEQSTLQRQIDTLAAKVESDTTKLHTSETALKDAMEHIP